MTPQEDPALCKYHGYRGYHGGCSLDCKGCKRAKYDRHLYDGHGAGMNED